MLQRDRGILQGGDSPGAGGNLQEVTAGRNFFFLLAEAFSQRERDNTSQGMDVPEAFNEL
jgi:hypothetical protein